jgi:hypothetical protein
VYVTKRLQFTEGGCKGTNLLNKGTLSTKTIEAGRKVVAPGIRYN